MSQTDTREIGRALSQWLRPARATLIRLLGDFDRAADASQEAALRALRDWPVSGVPDNPLAWLVTTGRHSAIDHLRRQRRDQALTDADAPAHTPDVELAHWQDDVLRLLFTCCHPALAEDIQIALTLQAVLDWEHSQIARALLLPTDTLAQRLLRGKRKIAAAGIAYEIPLSSALPARLAAVLRVIYLLYNAGYFVDVGDQLLNTALCGQALQLSRELMQLLPQQQEAAGLHALLLLLQARAPARLDDNGLPVLLSQQNRQRWQRTLIDEGVTVLQRALRHRQPGPYQIQAAINALHCEAATAADTDWQQIVLLYEQLLRYWPSPVVQLNQAVALMATGQLAQAQTLLAQLAAPLSRYQPFYLARAEWHRCHVDEAARQQDLQTALALSENRAQQQWLQAQL